jgi:hypothetical protein
MLGNEEASIRVWNNILRSHAKLALRKNWLYTRWCWIGGVG